MLVCASGSGMCEDGSAGDDAPYAVCPSIDDNPDMTGTMDQKDSNEGAEGAGSCAHSCKAQASAPVDVPTAPEVVPRDLRQCARRGDCRVNGCVPSSSALI